MKTATKKNIVSTQPKNKKTVVCITGTPGVGKTKLAVRLAKHLNADYISISELAKKHREIVKFYEQETDSLVLDIKGMCSLLNAIIKQSKKGCVVVDSHMSHLYDHCDIVIVLRLDPDVLEKRLKGRKYNIGKVKENVEAEVLDVCLIEAVKVNGKENVIEIDATGKSALAVYRAALDALKHKSKYKPGKINWLSKKFGNLSS